MIDTQKIIDEYLDKSDWRIKENSNIGFSLQGMNNHIVAHATSDYWLNKIYPAHIRESHINGDFHIHDLQSLSPYCMGNDLKDILVHGFTGVPGKVQSAPPKHLGSALGQLNNFIFTLQGEFSGAQAVSSFDTLLAPFICEDALEYNEVLQLIQEFIFNLNVPTRVGGQAPFSNITLDITASESALAEENVIVGGEVRDTKYKQYQREMDMINSAFCEVMSKGDNSGRVFTFPIPTYNITKTFRWDSDVAEKIFEMTRKYGIPYFANFINSDMSPEDSRSMCCRLRIDNRVLARRGGGLFGANPKTGSINVTTLNLPRIGYLANTKKELYDFVNQLMDIAKEQMIIKRKVLEDCTKNGLYPYSRFYMADVHERFGEYWKNHFSTIGIIGANEMLLNFLGKDIAHKDGQRFVLDLMEFMRQKLIQFQEETGDVWNLEATPAEGTTRRLAALDKKMYPEIIVANEKAWEEEHATPYYTNSTHLPVGYTDDVIEFLDLQEDLQTMYSGGTVAHIYLGESLHSAEATQKLVKMVAENYKIPYFTLTPSFSVCPVHGYLPGVHEYCPKCDSELTVNTNAETKM